MHYIFITRRFCCPVSTEVRHMRQSKVHHNLRGMQSLLLWMKRPYKQPLSHQVSQRGIYIKHVSAVTYCNHLLIIPPCTKIVPTHSICSSRSLFLFTGFFLILHFSILTAFPKSSQYWLLALVLQTSNHTVTFFSNHISPSWSFSLSPLSAWYSTSYESLSICAKAVSLCYSHPFLSISATQHRSQMKDQVNDFARNTAIGIITKKIR